jgi:hypothetical protein
MTTENENETELKNSRIVRMLFALGEKLESRSKSASNNHELISKLTFMLVMLLAYDSFGSSVFSVITQFI